MISHNMLDISPIHIVFLEDYKQCFSSLGIKLNKDNVTIYYFISYLGLNIGELYISENVFFVNVYPLRIDTEHGPRLTYIDRDRPNQFINTLSEVREKLIHSIELIKKYKNLSKLEELENDFR